MTPVLTAEPDTGLAPPQRPGRSCWPMCWLCSDPPPEPLSELEAVWISYDVRGMRHQQRVPLADPPAVSCGRAAGR